MGNSKTSGYAPVNGLNMYYEIHGSGNMPLVFIHGGGSTIETTFGNMLPLFAGYKVIAVELQAHGRTSDRDAPESFAQDADDVAALLKHLKIAKADIFGFSNGGSTAMQIAIRHPAVVNKIVVVSGAYKRDGFLPGLFEGMPHATINNMPEPLQAAFLKVTPDKDKLLIMFNKDKERMINFKDWPDADLRSIKTSALFISADQDVIIPAHTLQMSQLVPGARLAILPGSHATIIGETGIPADSKLHEITAALVQAFLNE